MGFIEIIQLYHVLHPSLAQILSGSHRAEVVEGEGLGDIIDDSLHGDHLGLFVELDDLSREDISNPWVKPDQVSSFKFRKHFGVESHLQHYFEPQLVHIPRLSHMSSTLQVTQPALEPGKTNSAKLQ